MMRHCRVNHCDKWATQAQDVDGEGGCVCRWGQGKEYAGTLKFPLNFIVNLKSEVKVAQPCLTLCEPMDCSLPGSSVHGILQVRLLEWVASPFSRESSQPKDRTQVSHIAGRFSTA